ncbi:hypothetical protein H4V96_001025 [Janthinobacterium sp. CG_23.4]|nr:hypothetical protein [Janthinobacterium sp. CG_23.4]
MDGAYSIYLYFKVLKVANGLLRTKLIFPKYIIYSSRCLFYRAIVNQMLLIGY